MNDSLQRLINELDSVTMATEQKVELTVIFNV